MPSPLDQNVTFSLPDDAMGRAMQSVIQGFYKKKLDVEEHVRYVEFLERQISLRKTQIGLEMRVAEASLQTARNRMSDAGYIVGPYKEEPVGRDPRYMNPSEVFGEIFLCWVSDEADS